MAWLKGQAQSTRLPKHTTKLMSDKISPRSSLEAIASIQHVGKAADTTFADLRNVQFNFNFIEPEKGLKPLTRRGQRFASPMKNTGNNDHHVRRNQGRLASPPGGERSIVNREQRDR
jgi:hypothetical protein